MKKLLLLCTLCFTQLSLSASVKLAWDASISPPCTATVTTLCVAGYDVYYGTSASTLTALADVGTALTYTVQNVPLGTRYYFGVKTYSTAHADSSALSNIVSSMAYQSYTENPISYLTPTAFGNDNTPINVGFKFKPIVSGQVLAIKVFIPLGYIGDRTVSLYDSNGALLATATLFEDGYKNGWQNIDFANPVQVTGGLTYVASWFSNGPYAYEANSFTSDIIANNISIPSVDNGVYSYSTAPEFPNLTYNSTNYFVDVVFKRDDQAVTTYSLPSGLVARYTFDSFSTTANGAAIVKDTLGNHGVATLTKSPSFLNTTGSIGLYSMYCDGNDEVTIPYLPYMSFNDGTKSQYTISAWAKPTVAFTDESFIIGRYTDASNSNYWSLQANGGAAGTGPYARFTTASGTPSGYAVLANSTPALNVWTHLVITYDSVTGFQRLYVNGITGMPPFSSVTRPTGALVKPTKNPMSLCGLPTNGITSGHFTGYVDEVQIYNRALTQTEVTTLYNQTGN